MLKRFNNAKSLGKLVRLADVKAFFHTIISSHSILLSSYVGVVTSLGEGSGMASIEALGKMRGSARD